MVEQDHLPSSGWQVGRSIAMELDILLTGMHSPTFTPAFRQEFNEMKEDVLDRWVVEWQQAFGKSRVMVSFLEILAFLSGTLVGEDYQAITLALRNLDLDQVRGWLEDHGRPRGLTVKADLSPAEQVVELGVELLTGTFEELGMQFTSPRTQESELRFNLTCLIRVLKDGDLHGWFWMWLDRLYFQVYQGWREARRDLLDHNESHAIMALGKAGGDGQPRTDWLPEQNPLLHQPAYLQAAGKGRLGLFFWVEPFGMADLISLFPGLLLVSFSEPGEVYQRFLENAQDLARRAKALADPTRLGILRIIRHFGMINTEIGRFMGISRPTVSIHAKLLREAGLIRSHEEGREMKHEIVPGELQRLFRDLEDFLDLPDQEESE